MIKRIVSLTVTIIMIASMVGSMIMPAFAVTPADPLIASALYSFLVSAGIKLWRDGIEGSDTAVDDMIDDMQTVWGFYKDEEGANVPSWSNIAGITTSNGKIILEHDTAQTFQGFADWLADYYEMVPNGTYAITSSSGSGDQAMLYTLPPSEASSLPRLNAGYWALPANSTSSTEYDVYRSNGKPLQRVSYSGEKLFSITNTAKPRDLEMIAVSLMPFTRIYTPFVKDGDDYILGEPGTPYTSPIFNRSSNYYTRCNGQFDFYMIIDSYSSYDYSVSHQPPVNTVNEASGTSVYEIAYVILYGDPVGTALDLFATIGKTVADKVGDLIDGQSLAIDVGASAGASEEEIIGAAAVGYSVPATAEVVPAAVATPVPIAGEAELYPQAQAASDVDGLGLPDLGRALTTRFPFCIPWDVTYLYQSLNAVPKRPVFTIDVIPTSLKQRIGITDSTAFTIDFGDERFAIMVKIVRWSTLFGFVLFLAFTTKRLIWTTGG